MIDEPRPCPFCGHPPEIFARDGHFIVRCVALLCPAQQVLVSRPVRRAAIGAWNCRPLEDRLREERDYLETIYREAAERLHVIVTPKSKEEMNQ